VVTAVEQEVSELDSQVLGNKAGASEAVTNWDEMLFELLPAQMYCTQEPMPYRQFLVFQTFVVLFFFVVSYEFGIYVRQSMSKRLSRFLRLSSSRR